ncbi:MAG: hypothetical protein MJ137_04790 [Clostridia bacterium]|nr:hypothetical protein [Clostridia bacterium]
MEVLKEHLIPILIMVICAVVCIAAEFLFKRKIIKVGEKTAGIISLVSVLLTVLIGAGLFIYLTVIGAGVEVMLPVILLILLGTMI